jgi:hypothetical protein
MNDGKQVNVMFMGMELVIAQLVLDPECYQDEAGHSNSQPQSIYESKDFVPAYIPEGNLQIIFDHGSSIVCSVL